MTKESILMEKQSTSFDFHFLIDGSTDLIELESDKSFDKLVSVNHFSYTVIMCFIPLLQHSLPLY